ncbi:MAG: PQQ-dependent sugar dehydrogenase [Proteobacteria bacterium]|nr:PQQ-dependent sugar dehydrogenase [Pseudomonadota bacterium]
MNLLKPGRNYGWPLVSLAAPIPARGRPRSTSPRTGIRAALLYWMPAISVSGLTFYTGDALPKWKGDLSSWVASDAARCPAPDGWIASCSTRGSRNCAANLCWASCTSASAT